MISHYSWKLRVLWKPAIMAPGSKYVRMGLTDLEIERHFNAGANV
jgi:hypothetical protein